MSWIFFLLLPQIKSLALGAKHTRPPSQTPLTSRGQRT